MKPEGHLEKAQAFENRATRWETDRDAPSVIEDIFDACVHYIAYGINVKFGLDIDVHASQKRFLGSWNELTVLHAYEDIERLRIGSVYGGKWNGERIRKSFEIMEVVKQWIGIPGK